LTQAASTPSRPRAHLWAIALAGFAGLAGVAFLLTTATSAAAAVTVTSYKITANLPPYPTVPSDGPSTLQAGANPDAGSYSSFSYPNATEDVKTALTNFAPGLLGNPEATPKCSEAALQAGGGGCPAGSQIGTSRLDVQVSILGSPLTGFPGVVYNAEPLGNEPGRLGVVTPTPSGTLVSSIPFTITPRGKSDYGLTGTLSEIARLNAPPPNLQVFALSFVINGATNSYVRNPTSCGPNLNTGEAFGYDDKTVAQSPTFTFTTTGCDQVSFGPKVAIQVGDRGTTKLNGYPPLVVRITQPFGSVADIKDTKITLPTELNTNNRAYKLCTQAQADADSCPANSKFGNTVATSPFLNEQLSGPVYLIQQSSSSLPGLLLDLRGRAHVKIQTSTSLVNNRLIQSLATNSPQLPISELRVALNGGKDTGVFQNRSDLCFNGSSTSKFNPVNGVSKLTGWNGKNTGDAKVSLDVLGCGPGVTASISRPISSSPRLSVKVVRHPDAPKMKEITLTLSKNLSLVESRLDEASGKASALSGGTLEFVNAQTLRVTGLPSDGARKLTLRLGDGSVRVSDRTKSLLRKGRSRRFSVKARQTPVTGSATSTRAKFSKRLR
jgi:hypothetical protein